MLKIKLLHQTERCNITCQVVSCKLFVRRVIGSSDFLRVCIQTHCNEIRFLEVRLIKQTE